MDAYQLARSAHRSDAQREGERWLALRQLPNCQPAWRAGHSLRRKLGNVSMSFCAGQAAYKKKPNSVPRTRDKLVFTTDFENVSTTILSVSLLLALGRL